MSAVNAREGDPSLASWVYFSEIASIYLLLYGSQRSNTTLGTQACRYGFRAVAIWWEYVAKIFAKAKHVALVILTSVMSSNNKLNF